MTEMFNHGYGLLIGVGESVYKPLSLPVTVKDTQAIHAVLIDPELCAYPDNEQHIRVLNNAEATRSNILDGLKWLKEKAESDSEATIFIYYSGHGWVNRKNNRYYLLQHDVKPSQLASSALSAETFTDALRQIQAKRLLVVIDSCHAAGMATSKDADAIAKADAELFEEFDDFKRVAPSKGLIEALTKGKGRAVFTSSEGEEKSWIRQDTSLSIYTYHFLEALQGAGNRVGDTEVKLSDLMGHISDTVSKTALKEWNAQQTPYFDLGGNNFAIAKLRGGKGLPDNGWDDVKSEAQEKIGKIAEVVMDKTRGKNIVGSIKGQNIQVGDRTDSSN